MLNKKIDRPAQGMIEVHRAKRSILRGPAEEQPRIVQEQTRFQTKPGTKQRCSVEGMSSRLFSIYEHGVHPLILKAVADIGKPIQHLKSSFTSAPHADDDQTARTHYVVKVQTFVVVRPQVYVRVDHVHSSANVWRCFVMQQRRIPTGGLTRSRMTIVLQ
jgi:hypothetical protein